MLPFQLPPMQSGEPHPVWTGHGFRVGEELLPLLEYSENFQGWSDELTELQEQVASDNHPIDQASRADAVCQLRHYTTVARPTILEVGCSSGFLLSALLDAFPAATIIGSDVVKAPLYRLAERLPQLPLLRFDLLQCPLPDASIDAIVMLNVLEHIGPDEEALRQTYRILKPGGVLAGGPCRDASVWRL